MNTVTKFTWLLAGMTVGGVLAVVSFYAYVCQQPEKRTVRPATKLSTVRKTSEAVQDRSA